MKVAYLVNQYPHVSHSFIRREIAALERQGISIARFSIRASGSELVDEADRAERGRTEVLLKGGVLHLLLALVKTALARPGRFLSATRLALRLGRRSDRGVLRHLAYLAEACLLVDLVRRSSVDHLHAHFGTNPAAVALLTHRLCGIPYSFTVHGPEEFDKPEGLSLGEKIAEAAFVVAISEYGRSQLYRWSSYEHWSKIRVIHCGVDDSFLQSEPMPVPETPRLVCVGRLAEQKGQLVLLDAAAQLAAEGIDFQLTLAGDGPMRPIVEEQIRRLRLERHVRITGWISNAQVREEIRQARLFVLPSFAEGLPVVLMEALALGRPVVSTYVAGIPELVQPNVSGWLVPAGSVADLAEALREALQTSSERLESMGRVGAERVAAQHDASREASRLAALFTGKNVPARLSLSTTPHESLVAASR